MGKEGRSRSLRSPPWTVSWASFPAGSSPGLCAVTIVQSRQIFSFQTNSSCLSDGGYMILALCLLLL